MINAYNVSVWTKTLATLAKGLEEVAQTAHVQLMDSMTGLKYLIRPLGIAKHVPMINANNVCLYHSLINYIHLIQQLNNAISFK